MYNDLESYDTLYNAQYYDEQQELQYQENVLRNSFDNFKYSNPTYLEDLNNRIDHLYSIYSLICGKQFSRINQNPEYNETACRLGLGMLLRHALEVLSIDILFRKRIDASGMTVFERLDKLKGQFIDGYDTQTEKTLHQALDLTNEIAHPHLIGNCSSTKTLYDFYQSQFRNVIEAQTQQASRRDVQKYLIALKKDLDSFNIQNKITYDLLSGCLVRHLTECATNLWCFSNSLVPTDASTFENQISLHSVLKILSEIARGNRNSGFGASALTPKVIDVLFELKNTSNSMMHVSPENIKTSNIHVLGDQSRGLYSKITTECSPFALELKRDKFASDTPSLVSTLLCGFLGWFGIHHFYGGNIGKGILYLLTSGFFIGPFFSLNKLRTGNFQTKKWGTLPKNRLTSILSVVFMLLHIALLYIVFFRS